MKQTMSKNKIEIEKREVREEKINITTARAQERRQHARGIRILHARKQRGGGVAPRRNRITESAKESWEAKRKAKKIQETNGKTTRRKDKTKKEREHGERQNGRALRPYRTPSTPVRFGTAFTTGGILWCVPYRKCPSLRFSVPTKNTIFYTKLTI